MKKRLNDLIVFGLETPDR